MRDENGFKQHTMSESHVRNMQLIGENPKKFIRQYSEEFKSDFVKLLRTAHGEKPVHLNRFYQEYIANKEHVHMNATQWSSLHEFAKYLGREGICRVTEAEGKGVYISWVDNSPEALRRQDAIRKKERQDRGDEEREKKAIQEQIERAHRETREAEQDADGSRALERKEGEKITLQFGGKPKQAEDSILVTQGSSQPIPGGETTGAGQPAQTEAAALSTSIVSIPVKILFCSTSSKPKNVFAAAKNTPLAAKKGTVKDPAKKMSEAERIMREEMDREKRKGPHEHGTENGEIKKKKIRLGSASIWEQN